MALSTWQPWGQLKVSRLPPSLLQAQWVLAGTPKRVEMELLSKATGATYLARSTVQNKELRNKQPHLFLSSQNSLSDKALPLAFYPKPRNFTGSVFALRLETIPRAEFSVLSC